MTRPPIVAMDGLLLACCGGPYPVALVPGDAVENAAHDGYQDAAHKGRSKAGNGDTRAQQIDRQVAGQLEHKAVDYELKNTKRDNSERQRDDRQERLDERVDDVEEQSHKGKADPGLGKAEGLDTRDEKRGDRDGDRGEEPVKHKAHGVNPFLRRGCWRRVKRLAAATWMVARARRGVWAPIVSNIRGAYVRIRFLNGVRPEKRAAGREFCRFSLVVCYTATGKSHRRCPIA